MWQQLQAVCNVNSKINSIQKATATEECDDLDHVNFEQLCNCQIIVTASIITIVTG